MKFILTCVESHNLLAAHLLPILAITTLIAVCTLPGCAHTVADLVILHAGMHSHDVANDFMSWDMRVVEWEQVSCVKVAVADVYKSGCDI